MLWKAYKSGTYEKRGFLKKVWVDKEKQLPVQSLICLSTSMHMPKIRTSVYAQRSHLLKEFVNYLVFIEIFD
jgi:hypothetical protein